MVPTAGHGIGKPWQVRYRDLDGQQRKENFDTKARADNRAAEVDIELRRGTYLVPTATKETLGSYAQKWLDSSAAGPTTALRYEATVRNHIAAHLGRCELRSLNRPPVIQGWIRKLQDAELGASTIEGVFDILSSILGAAADDGLLPAAAGSPSAGRPCSLMSTRKAAGQGQTRQYGWWPASCSRREKSCHSWSSR
jgi:hypothetical protein